MVKNKKSQGTLRRKSAPLREDQTWQAGLASSPTIAPAASSTECSVHGSNPALVPASFAKAYAEAYKDKDTRKRYDILADPRLGFAKVLVPPNHPHAAERAETIEQPSFAVKSTSTYNHTNAATKSPRLEHSDQAGSLRLANTEEFETDEGDEPMMSYKRASGQTYCRPSTRPQIHTTPADGLHGTKPLTPSDQWEQPNASSTLFSGFPKNVGALPGSTERGIALPKSPQEHLDTPASIRPSLDAKLISELGLNVETVESLTDDKNSTREQMLSLIDGQLLKLRAESEEEQSILKGPEAYTQPFCEFLTDNPTVWHAVQYFEKKLGAAGFKKLSERQSWVDTLEKGGKFYTTRNGSSLIAFTVGSNYKAGNGVAMIAGHVDALTARLKAVSSKKTTAGYVQLGVAPYAGALNSTWWDRDLGIGGRVLVKDSKTGKIETKLVKLGWPIARIPTLAPHFGVGTTGSNNAETEAVPIIGLDNSSSSSPDTEFKNLTLGEAGSFAATQPPKLVKAIAGELSIQDYSSIVNWELELFDTQPAQVGGLDKEFIFAGRIDDKLCSWSAMEALLVSSSSDRGKSSDDAVVKLVGVFDDEEIGSLLRQGAKGNFLPSTIERITESFAPSSSANILSQTYANSFLISADVTHAVNPNFLARYLENHAPRLNVGLVVCADSNGHMTTDSVSTALLTRVAEKTGSELQVFAIRNDSRSGGTVGPMLSSAMGVRAIDAGIPQLSMHSIRATTGALDPGLGVKIFAGFFEHFQSVDAEFE